MFQSIDCVGSPPKYYHYTITDDNFRHRIYCSRDEVDIMPHKSTTARAIMVLECYMSRPQTAKNVALYYYHRFVHELLFKNPLEVMENDRKYIDSSRSGWRYGEKYYPCVIRHLKQLTFGNKRLHLE